jgi:hypothetical protein
MPRYSATFTVSCMTRQAFETLAKRLSQSVDVADVRVVASFTGGQMLLDCTAPDRPALDAWMAKEHLVPSEVIRLDVQVENGEATAFA